MKNINKTEQSGRSMVEMLGVLAIIGVLSVGGISGYSKAMSKFKLTKVQDQLSMMIMNIRTAYATSPGYPNLTNELATTNKLVSQEMIVGGSDAGQIIHALGGSVLVKSLPSLDNVADGAFAIALNGLNKNACVSMASADWGSDGLLGVNVSGEAVNAIPAAIPDDIVKPNNLPISYGDAVDSCTSDTSNSITWYYN